MTYEELINHFGSDIKAAAELGFSVTAVKNWANSTIPRNTQYAIQALTENKLIVDANLK
jgi:hypothetical protein